MKNSRSMFDLKYLLKELAADDVDRLKETDKSYHCCYAGATTRITNKTQYFKYFNYG